MSIFLPPNRLIHFFIFFTLSLFASLHGQTLVATASSPTASPSSVLSGCIGLSYTFTGQTNDTLATASWVFTNGTPGTANGLGPHNVSFSGNGWAVLTVTNGAQTVVDSIEVLVSPNITVAPTLSGTVGQTFEGVFYATRCNQVSGTVIIGNNVAGWQPGTVYTVDFGDGSPIATPTPNPGPGPSPAPGSWSLIKSYATGNHVLTIIGTNGNCVKTYTQPIYVGSQPNVGFAINSSTTLCVPDSIAFPISSVSQNSMGTRYVVNVNDGSQADTFFHPPPANYMHNFTFSSCGSLASTSNQGNSIVFQNSYQAIITAANPCGNATVSLQPIYVSSKNQTGFTVTPDSLICINSPVLLNDTTRYGLDVGATSCDSLPLRIWNVYPSTGWTLTSGSMGDAQGFTSGGPFGYDPSFWITGTPDITLSFSQPGTYNLVLRTGNGCGEDTAVTPICIDPPITANFDISDSIGCFPLVVSTTNLSTLGSCNRDKYYWTVTFTDTIGCGNNDWAFINGTDSISFQPVFQFNGPGIYDIQLETNPRLNPEDATRCPVDTAVKRIVVKDRPNVSLSFTSPICQTDTAFFTETIINCYGTQPLTYLWTLTGALPATDTTVNPGAVLYQSHGLFPVSLLVTNECGADTALDTIDVRQPVIVNVTPGTNACMNDAVSVNGSFGGGAIIASWNASVPGGGFAPNNTTQPATYTPPSGYTGNLDVYLITNDPPGPCPADTAIATYVFDQNGISLPGSYADLCQNGTQLLAGAVGGAATTGTWSAQPVGTFTPDANTLTAVYTPPSGYVGPVTLTLITNDPPGTCLSDTAATTFAVNPIPIADPVVPATICSGDTTQLALTAAAAGTVFSWVPVANANIVGATAGNGLIIQQALVNNALTDQVQQYTVTPSLNGCPGPSITVSVNIRANTLMVPSLDATVCPGQIIGPYNFVSNPPGASFSWVASNSSLGINSGIGPIPALPAPANQSTVPVSASVVVTPTLNNCAGTPDTFVVTVNPTPDVSNTPLSDSLCSGTGSQPITFTSNVAGTTFTWTLSSNVGVSPGALAAGSNVIPSQTLTAAGNTTGVLTYAVTPLANGCPGVPVNYEVYVLPIPDVILPAGQAICPGATSNPVALNSSVSGTTFTWTSSPIAGVAGNSLAGSGNLPAQTLTNSNAAQATVTYVITPEAEGCVGTPANYVISVEGSPNVSFLPGPQVICSNGNTIPIALSSTTPGVSFSWSMVLPPSITYGGSLSGTGNPPAFNFVNTGTTPDSVILTAIATPPGAPCPGNPFTYAIVVNPVPTMTLTPANTTVCSNVGFSLVNASTTPGTTFSWTVSTSGAVTGQGAGTGDTISQIVINTTGADQTVTYTTTPVFAGCVGTPVSSVVTVQYEPAITGVPDVTVCSAGAVNAINFSSTPPGATFAWQNNNAQTGLALTGSGNIAAFTANANNTSTAEQSTIIVTPTANGCAGLADTFLLVVQPNPTVTNNPLAQINCSGVNTQAVVFTGNVSGSTFTWNLNSTNNLQPIGLVNGTDQIPSQILTANTIAGGNAVYVVTPSANNCVGTPVNYTFTIAPTPAMILPASQTICSGDTMATTVLNATTAGATFTWTASATGGITGFTPSGTGNLPPDLLVNPSFVPETVTFSITPTTGGCVGSPANYVVTVQPTPNLSINPSTQAVCSGVPTVPLNVASTTPGAQFSWTSVSPATLTGATASGTGNIPAQTLNHSGTATDSVLFIVTPSTGACSGPADSAYLVVYPIPDVTANPSPASICSGATTNIALSGNVVGTTFSWTVSNNVNVSGSAAGTGATIAQTLTQATLSPQTLIYTITPTANGCPGTPIQVNADVLPIPVLTPTADMSLCPVQTSNAISFSSNIPSTNFTWTQSNVSTGAPASGTGNFPSFVSGVNNGATAITGVVIVTPSANGCAGLADTFNVVVQPLPSVTNNPLGQTVCSSLASAPIVFTGNVPGATYTWNLTNTNNLQAGALASGTDSIPAQNLTTISIANGDATYTIVPSANGCIGGPVQYVYSIAPNPDVNLPVAQILCSGNPTAVVNPTSSVAGVSFNWTAVATGGITGFSASGTGSIPSFNPVNPSPSVQTITYTITPSANGCIGTPVNYLITVEPTVVLNLNPAMQSICDGGTSVQITATTSTPGAVISWAAQAPVTLTGWTGSGTGNVPALNLQNTGNQTDTLIIIYTPAFAGCNGVADTAMVLVHPTPNVVANPANQTICSGGGINIGLSGNVQGTVFNWVPSVNPAISGATTASGNAITDILSQSGTTSQNLSYTITPSANACPGAPIQVPITVLPIPVITPQPNIQVCASQPVAAINFTSNVPGTNITWTNSNSGVGLPPSGAGNIPGYNAPIHNGPGSVTGQIITRPSAAGCFGISDTFDIVVLPQPLAVVNPINSTICSNQSTAIGLSSALPGTQFSWIVNAGGLNGTSPGTGNLIAQTLVNPGVTTLTAQYIITPTLNGCIGPNDTATVSVTPAAQLNVVTGPTNFCSGGSTNIQLSSPVPGATFSWTLAGGQSILGDLPGNGATIVQNLTNPSNAIDSVTYNIVPTFNGCALAPTSVTVVVNPIPSGIATPDTSTICGGTTTGIQLISTVANTTFNWTVNAGPSISGASPGTGQLIGQTLNNSSLATEQVVYNITYSANGCAGAPIQAVVNVNPVAPAAANPTALTVCSGQPFQIAVSSPVNGATLSWTTAPNPNVAGAIAGAGDTISNTLTTAVAGGQIVNYLISATFQNCPGPLLVVPVTVNALPAVNPGLAQTSCLNSPPINLVGFSPAGGTWSGPGITTAQPGTFTPSVAGVGAHAITYSFTDPVTTCSNTANINMVVNPLPTLSYTHDTLVCVNAPINLVNTTQGATQHAWVFGNGTNSNLSNPIQAYPAPGLYTISYTATTALGCSAGSNSTIRVITAPAANFVVAPSVGCSPMVVNFNNQTAAYTATYLWNLGNGTTSTLVTPPPTTYFGSTSVDTTYVISLTATNQCGNSTFIDTLRVLSQPVAFFGTNVSVGCSPLTIQLSQNSFGGPTSFSWNFGNGTASAASLPGPQTFVYNGTTDTTYYITLTVTNPCGSSTHVDSVRVLPNNITPFFNTNPTSGCAPLAVNFTNFTTGANVYNWDFGDGNVSNLMNPSHTYVNGGNYNVMLAANNGCSFDTIYFMVNVLPQPSVSFVVAQDSLCQNVNMQFINTSPNLSNLFWNFGDGNTSTLTNPTNAYAQGGTYNVSLIGTAQASGCTDTAHGVVFIKPGIDVAINLSDSIGCAPFQVQFQDVGQGAIFHQWDYGDGQTGASSSPTHTYLTFGSYITQLVGSNQWGCTDTATANVWVNPVPNAAFTVPPINTCVYPATFQLTNTSSGATGYQWNLGNGQNSVQFEPVVTYNQPDTFAIQLVATNAFGCSDTAVQSVIMNQNVVANFLITPEVGCAPHKADLIDLSTGADTWSWNFGDGDSSIVQNPIHVYQNAGVYTVTLIASNQAGCGDTLTLTNAVLVNPSPTAAFLSSPPERSFLTPVVDLLDLSTGGISAFYNMGNGQINTLMNGQYIYPSPDTGTYIISQIVVNQFGCTDTAFSTIRLFGETSLYVPTAFTPNDDGKNDVFRAYGFNLFEYELQIFNRWGELIFETNDLMDAWNGTKFNAGGPVCKSDVYVWRIAYRDIDRVRHRVRGRVTLLNNGTE